ncbi:MAG TPA: hypothetical protein VF533_14945 [Solirubrobacteraceae bacterium]|jgi:hypothetical protein
MIILITTIFSLGLWVILWAIGAKGFDAFLVALLLILGAATWHIISPYLPGNRREQHPPPGS